MVSSEDKKLQSSLLQPGFFTRRKNKRKPNTCCAIVSISIFISLLICGIVLYMMGCFQTVQCVFINIFDSYSTQCIFPDSLGKWVWIGWSSNIHTHTNVVKLWIIKDRVTYSLAIRRCFRKVVLFGYEPMSDERV